MTYDIYSYCPDDYVLNLRFAYIVLQCYYGNVETALFGRKKVQRNNIRRWDQFRLLGNRPPTPPLSHH